MYGLSKAICLSMISKAKRLSESEGIAEVHSEMKQDSTIADHGSKERPKSTVQFRADLRCT